MQVCRDKGSWSFEEIKDHQARMVSVLMSDVE